MGSRNRKILVGVHSRRFLSNKVRKRCSYSLRLISGTRGKISSSRISRIRFCKVLSKLLLSSLISGLVLETVLPLNILNLNLLKGSSI